jgi:uncharacterized protein YndB with AHSA1/START domain
MRSSITISVVAVFALVAPVFAFAAVDDEAPNGFTISKTVTIAASSDRVYAAIIAPAHWWDSEHTYSHSAANLSLDPRAGGCWCETLPGGGSVQHLVVVSAIPGKLLRLRGALGPLQGMAVDGAMTFSLHASGNGTELTLGYAVGGYSKQGFGELATAVDSVLAEQTARLKRFVETSSPESNHQQAKQGD